ncbi:hypothetical protein DL768_007158 [Monosporascus sp. mg162]|nr:hypothetical protein DL768_007158 [Monosporascus sp. mg162]
MHTSQGVVGFLLLCNLVFAAWIYDHQPIKAHSTDFVKSSPETTPNAGNQNQVNVRQSVAYWLPKLAPAGKQPLSVDGYKFYRDVTDYGAKNDGSEDASEAINAAVRDGNRCGQDCGRTFSLGAIVYFPFIGDPNNRPIIKGCDTFKGAALFDVNPYVPGGSLREKHRYINQEQFFRQIRNFIFDMTEMPLSTDIDDQPLAPTGLHWQNAQATSLQNLQFRMPKSTGEDRVTHIGIFTENGSGGFVSGSQQYTARNIKYTSCATAVEMLWDWGFNWQEANSTIRNVKTGILTNDRTHGAPNIVLDNVAMSNVESMVQVHGGDLLLSGTPDDTTIALWATGRRYTGGDGTSETGDLTMPSKPEGLLANGRLFSRSRPQYEDLDASAFMVATDKGIANDGTGDQTQKINAFLQEAQAVNAIAYFPAGIYQVQGTVKIPTGSKLQGSSWSQVSFTFLHLRRKLLTGSKVMGTGSFFEDSSNPQVMVQVGKKGDRGSLEIVDMLFTVKGPTAGAILMEWNVRGDSQGSAGMWDSHFRVGGALGSDLDHRTCPTSGVNEKCIAASLLLHVTPEASGYFENVWAWIADHDNDITIDPQDLAASRVNVYAARGMLIESLGPSWFYATSAEHAVLYQYQLYEAKNIYLGHIQTETPYYQPAPLAPEPFSTGSFSGDPDFADCTEDSCKESWALRIIDSSQVILHSAGMYSFFSNYTEDCVNTEDCQQRIAQVTGSNNITLFNIFTKGSREIASGNGS